MAALNIGVPGGRSARSTSAPVNTPSTPGARARLAHVDRGEAGVGDRGPHVGDVGRAVELRDPQVGDVGAARP